MHTHARHGTTLCEIIIALTLLSTTTLWALGATSAAARLVRTAHARQAALERAELALADLAALPCDSVAVNRTTTEPRWRITMQRDHDGRLYRDAIALRTTTGDTVHLFRGGWCE